MSYASFFAAGAAVGRGYYGLALAWAVLGLLEAAVSSGVLRVIVRVRRRGAE